MDTAQDRLTRLSRALEQAKTLANRAQGQKEQLEVERTRILAEMASEGVTPETLEAEIAQVERELDTALETGERLVPWDLLGKGDGNGASRN